jgi:ribosome-binding protein aMBF1 (putative translation factor)
MIWDAEQVRTLRRRLGWSQGDLARRLKIDVTRVRDIEMEFEDADAEISRQLELYASLAESCAMDMAQHMNQQHQVDT